MKLKIIILLIVITVFSFITTGCVKKSELTDAEKFKEEYESINNEKNEKTGKKNRVLSISKDNPFVYQTAEDIVKKIDNKESFIVYFGFNDCPWCRAVLEELIKSSKKYEVETIYYVDIKNIRDVKEVDSDGTIKTTKEGEDAYLKLVDRFDNVLKEYTIEQDDEEIDIGEKRIYAPNVIAVSNGESIQLEDGISDKLEDPYGKLTEEMKRYANKKFSCLFKCLEEESTTCQKNAC